MKMKATSKTFHTDKAFKDRCVVVVDSFSRNNFLENYFTTLLSPFVKVSKICYD